MKKSFQANAFNFVLKYCFKPFQAHFPLIPMTMRTLRTFSLIGDILGLRLPGFVRVQPLKTSTFKGEWVSTPESDSDRVILFFHGGAFFCGSPRSHRPISWRLAYYAKVRVLSVDYRLLPENSIDDALDDAFHAYQWLLENGCKPENITMGGDSAGGGLTVLTMLRLKKENLPLPASAYCMSPFVNHTRDSGSMVENAGRSIMFHANLVKSMERYIKRTLRPDHRLFVTEYEDFSGLPPIFVQVGDNELLLDDSLLIVSKYKKAGQKVVLDLWHKMPHAFTLFSGILPEGVQGIKNIAGFIRDAFGLDIR